MKLPHPQNRATKQQHDTVAFREHSKICCMKPRENCSFLERLAGYEVLILGLLTLCSFIYLPKTVQVVNMPVTTWTVLLREAMLSTLL